VCFLHQKLQKRRIHSTCNSKKVWLIFPILKPMTKVPTIYIQLTESFTNIPGLVYCCKTRIGGSKQIERCPSDSCILEMTRALIEEVRRCWLHRRTFLSSVPCANLPTPKRELFEFSVSNSFYSRVFYRIQHQYFYII